MLATLLMLSALLLTSCCKEPEVKYIDKPYEVKVPVVCDIPDVHCDFNKTTQTEVVASLMECIIEQKKAMEVCDGL